MSAANTVRDSSTADLSSRSSKLKRGAISEASLALHSQSKNPASSIQAESSLREGSSARTHRCVDQFYSLSIR
jgi:hypothetical protein